MLNFYDNAVKQNITSTLIRSAMSVGPLCRKSLMNGNIVYYRARDGERRKERDDSVIVVARNGNENDT